MANTKVIQPSPAKTQEANDTISPLPWYQPRTEIKDRGTPSMNSTVPPAMAGAEDTQPGPTETPPRSDTTIPLAEPDVETPKDLLTTWGHQSCQIGKSGYSHHCIGGQVSWFPHPVQPCGRRRTVCIDCDSLHGDAEFGGHWGHPQGHGDCLSQESGPWEPQLGSHPPRTHQREQGGWLSGVYSGRTGGRGFGGRPPLNVSSITDLPWGVRQMAAWKQSTSGVSVSKADRHLVTE